MNEREPVTIGIAGLGGYAGNVRQFVLQAAGSDPRWGEPLVKLAAVCDVDPWAHTEVVAELQASGVKVLDSFDALLAEPVEAVYLPLPIHLHRPFAERALAAGKAVVCEKPAAGCIDDVDAMIAARDRAGLPLLIGFQDLYDTATLAIKRRLVDGVIGPLRRAAVTGCWPRPDSYYQRNDWAGALQRHGTWVLDSPANNALAHYVNLALFLLGPEPLAIAEPTRVEAELYRARRIENYDTCAIRATTGSDTSLLALLTHACARQIDARIVVDGENGRMVWTMHDGAAFESAAGQTIESIPPDATKRVNIVRKLASIVRGYDEPDIPGCPVDLARPHAVVISAASQAVAVADVPASEIEPTDKGAQAVPGIEDAIVQCAEAHQTLDECGRFNWTTPATGIDVRGYDHFTGPAGQP